MSLDNQLCFYSESYKSLNINEYEKWIKSNKEKINIRTQKLKELMRTVLTVLINEIDTLDGIEEHKAISKLSGVKFFFERIIGRPELVKDQFDLDEFNQSYTIDDLFKINNLVEYISVRSNLYFILDIGEDEKIEPWEV
jgi:hypothetical protein